MKPDHSLDQLVLSAKEFAAFLSKNQLNLDSWPQTQLPGYYVQMMEEDKVEHQTAGFAEHHINIPQAMVFTEFGPIVGYTYVVGPDDGLPTPRYHAGLRLFIDCCYFNPYYPTLMPIVRTSLNDVIEGRLKKARLEESEVEVDMDFGVAAVYIFTQGASPELDTSALVEFVVHYFNSGSFKRDVARSMYDGLQYCVSKEPRKF